LYRKGSRTRFGIISLKKRSSLLKPLKSEKEPFYGSFSLCADKIRINANNKFSFNFGGMSALYDNYIRGQKDKMRHGNFRYFIPMYSEKTNGF